MIEKDQVIENLKQQLKCQKKITNELEIKNLHLTGLFNNLKSKEFSYENLCIRKVTFKYLCGLAPDQFNMLFECVVPYLHLLPCYSNKRESSLSHTTQMLSLLVICRHGLDLSFMAFLLEKSF